METTRIIENFGVARFRGVIARCDDIYVSPHAFDRLSEAQRKIFGAEELVKIFLTERPCGVGLQKNGRFSVFYRRKWGYLRIIMIILSFRIEIITFIKTENIPNLGRLKK